MTRARIVKSSVAVLAATLLAGCGLQPGSAAVVGDTVISQQQVDDVATALCSVQTAGGQGQDVPSGGARQSALEVLLTTELSRQFGEDTGVRPDQAKVSEAIAQTTSGLEQLPAVQRDDLRQTLTDFYSAQTILVAAGQEALAAQGKQGAGDEQALAVGNQLRSEWAKSVDVEVDPRYGSLDEATLRLRGEGGSLSVAQSDAARAAGGQEPAPAWVASLPQTQKC